MNQVCNEHHTAEMGPHLTCHGKTGHTGAHHAPTGTRTRQWSDTPGDALVTILSTVRYVTDKVAKGLRTSGKGRAEARYDALISASVALDTILELAQDARKFTPDGLDELLAEAFERGNKQGGDTARSSMAMAKRRKKTPQVDALPGMTPMGFNPRK